MATMGTMPRRPHVAMMLRLPPELHARLAEVAEREHRSATAQVVHVLERWLDADERARRRHANGEGEPGPAAAPEVDPAEVVAREEETPPPV